MSNATAEKTTKAKKDNKEETAPAGENAGTPAGEEAGRKGAKSMPTYYTQTEKGEKIPVDKLGRRDFPTTMEGRIAYCDYQILKYEYEKANIIAEQDPKVKAERRLEAILAEAEALRAEIAAANEAAK